MIQEQILRSTEDRSINFVHPTSDGGAIEARFVQRLEDTIIVYLSSATGCNKSCRFCHLTQTNQTMTKYVDAGGYYDQALEVLETVSKEGKLEKVTTVHFNFMARGDALANPHFVNDPELTIHSLQNLADGFELKAKFKISTIFPVGVMSNFTPGKLYQWITRCLYSHPEIEFYYSLYSLSESFRKRWIPKTLSPDKVGYAFRNTTEKLRLHHALIEGENTSYTDIRAIGDWLETYFIKCRLNIVQYNPFDVGSGTEPSENIIGLYKKRMEELDNIIAVHLISPVGRDVKASCGTFVS